MMDLKYNEKEYAMKIEKDGFLTKFKMYEMVIVVKYWSLEYDEKEENKINRDKRGYKKTKRDYIENKLKKFCEEHIEGYTYVKYFKQIDRALNNGLHDKVKLLILNKIPLLKCEIEHIDKLHLSEDNRLDHEYKKILLSFLIKKKINKIVMESMSKKNYIHSNLYGNTNNKFKEVLTMANLSTDVIPKINVPKIMHDLGKLENVYKEGLYQGELSNIITILLRGAVNLVFLDKIEYTEDTVINKDDIVEYMCKWDNYEYTEEDIYCNITDFNNIGYVFDYYKGENKVKKCECCGELFKVKSKTKSPKYCSKCAKEKHKEKDRVYQNKKYNKILDSI